MERGKNLHFQKHTRESGKKIDFVHYLTHEIEEPGRTINIKTEDETVKRLPREAAAFLPDLLQNGRCKSCRSKSEVFQGAKSTIF